MGHEIVRHEAMFGEAQIAYYVAGGVGTADGSESLYFCDIEGELGADHMLIRAIADGHSCLLLTNRAHLNKVYLGSSLDIFDKELDVKELYIMGARVLIYSSFDSESPRGLVTLLTQSGAVYGLAFDRPIESSGVVASDF